MAPRVLISNAMLVPKWADWDTFRELEHAGLTMYGQMTAGSWIYIGTQGILQGTYETLAECATQRFGGTLAGTITLTGGLGGMGGAQPLAVTMNGGVALCIDVDPTRIERRIKTGYLDRETDSVDEAVAWAEEARAAREPLSIGLLGNCADVEPELLARGFRPEVVTDQTSAHDPLAGYVPAALSLEEASMLRERDPDAYQERSRVSMARHVEAMVPMPTRGSYRPSCARCSAKARDRSAGPRSRGTRRTSRRRTERSPSCSRTTTGCCDGSTWLRSGSRSRAFRPGSVGWGTASGRRRVSGSTTWSRAASSRRRS
jgi:urocanate hydratase